VIISPIVKAVEEILPLIFQIIEMIFRLNGQAAIVMDLHLVALVNAIKYHLVHQKSEKMMTLPFTIHHPLLRIRKSLSKKLMPNPRQVLIIPNPKLSPLRLL
jgi:hypothetical protein